LYQQRVREVVVPRARALGIFEGDGRLCNRGDGPFDTEEAALCYLICQAPMHYMSFRNALDLKFPARNLDPLPESPIVIDLGCGPATTLFALADWMRQRRNRNTSISYIGLDVSQPLLSIARDMSQCPELFDESCLLTMYDASTALDQQTIMRAARGRNGVVFALSYIVHQTFMRGMAELADLMGRVSLLTRGLPTWFLLQDANVREVIGEHTHIWPENRVNVLADKCLPFGYDIKGEKTIFSSPRIRVRRDGTFKADEMPEKRNVCHFFQQIA
jgi:SAM-dependent methyltransferase